MAAFIQNTVRMVMRPFIRPFLDEVRRITQEEVADALTSAPSLEDMRLVIREEIERHAENTRVINKVEELMSQIVVLKSNPHYRIGDVYYRKGYRFVDSTEQVASLVEFKGTILRQYIEEVNDIEQPDLQLLSQIIDQAVVDYSYPLPQDDELVIHMRAGDVVEHPWFFKKDISRKIERFADTVNICTFVICFAFQEFQERGLWLFSGSKLAKNKEVTKKVLSEVVMKFPNLEFKVISNSNIDKDFVYMIHSPFFLRDMGGFSDLVCAVRNLRSRKRVEQ